MQLYTKILIGMAIGIILGFLVGPNSTLLPQDGAKAGPGVEISDEPDGEPFAVIVSKKQIPDDLADDVQPVFVRKENVRRMKIQAERDGWLRVGWKLTPQDVVRLEAHGLDKVRAGQEFSGWLSADQPSVSRYAPIGKMLVDWTEWIGRLFLAMIKMVVVPLVFFSLIVGVASLGDFRKLGKMGGATLGFFTLTTMVALTIGIVLTNLIKPGEFLSEEDRAGLLSSYSGDAGSKVASAADAPSLVDQIVNIVPTNPFQALADGDMLAVIFVAAMIGIAFTLMEQKRASHGVKVIDSLNEAMVTLVHIAMLLAPYGVAALLFEVVGSTGFSVLVALGVYGLVVLLGLLLHILITYMSVVKFIVKLPFLGFIKSIRAAMVLAFSTSSSSATLPVTMEALQDNVKVSEETASFVLPIGATVNMDGTALYQAVAAVFIAQIYGIDLSIGDQATIVVSATMASIGAAGVPGAGMITLAMVLTAIGVPTEGVALVLGVDRILDMFRTSTNVVGDATATTLIATMQGESLRIVSPEEDAMDPEHGFEGRTLDQPHSIRVDED
jgi:Na+/H+-dicarboxylate symporter